MYCSGYGDSATHNWSLSSKAKHIAVIARDTPYLETHWSRTRKSIRAYVSCGEQNNFSLIVASLLSYDWTRGSIHCVFLLARLLSTVVRLPKIAGRLVLYGTWRTTRKIYAPLIRQLGFLFGRRKSNVVPLTGENSSMSRFLAHWCGRSVVRWNAHRLFWQ